MSRRFSFLPSGECEQEEKEEAKQQREHSRPDNTDDAAAAAAAAAATEASTRTISVNSNSGQEDPEEAKESGGGELSIGSRLRFKLLASKRRASVETGGRTSGNSSNNNDHQGLLSWRDEESGSASGQMERRADGSWRAIARATGSEWCEPNNNSARRRLASKSDDGGDGGGRSQASQSSTAYSKILFRQYLPSCSFNLNDHTARNSNNKFAVRPPSSTTGQKRAGGGRGGEQGAAQGGGGGGGGSGGGEEEEAAQVVDGADDERINFATETGQRRARRPTSESETKKKEGGNNAVDCRADASVRRRAAAAAAAAAEAAEEEEARSLKESEQLDYSSLQGACKRSGHQRDLSLAKSIASAWSRFRISSGRNRGNFGSSDNQLRSSLLNNNHDELHEAQPQKTTAASRSHGHNERPKQSVLEIKRRELEALKLRKQFEQFKVGHGVSFERRSGAEEEKVVSSWREDSVMLASERVTDRRLAESDELQTGDTTVDLNNNNSSSSSSSRSTSNKSLSRRCNNLNQRISNYAHQLKRGARNSNCLLEEDDEQEEHDLERPKMLINLGDEEDSKRPRGGGAEKMWRKKEEAEAEEEVGRLREEGGMKPSRAGAALLSSTCYLATTAIWLFLVLAGAQLALGQQHQHQHQPPPPPPPFARSQLPQTSSTGGGPPPLASAGLQMPAPMGGPQGRVPASSGAGVPLKPAIGSLVANISCNKIRGHVTLTPNLEGGATVTTQISAGPPGEVYQWSIHQFPIKPGAAMCSCSSLILGSKLVDLSEMHGNLPSDQEFSVQSTLQLFDFDSPLGHSLLLRGIKTGMLACATFLPTNRKSNYRAKFHTPLSGSVTIFQTSFGTSFLAHLMYSNGTRRHSMHRFDLVRSDDDIITTSLLSGQQAHGAAMGPATNQAAKSVDQLEQREHEHELQACAGLTSGGEPLFRNLTYQLAVSTENFGMRGRTALVLPQIPFETFSSVYVVVYSEHDPNEPIACAPLRFVKPKTAAAKFQTLSVQGNIVFSQDSPYDVTVARINLNFPNSDGHSYGIDELPMIIRRKSDTRVCPNIREIIYNPHHVEPSSVPPEGEATSDQYAVGDLSGKYGSLTGKSSEKITVSDNNLPLFGPVSIVGRALTIYSAEGVAIACSNVELTAPMTTAFATFDYGIQGQFIFRQPMNDCNGDTYVYIEVSKPTAGPGSQPADKQQLQAVASLAANNNQQQHDHHSSSRSLDHNWHIHLNPVDSGLEHLSTTDCSPAGPHFNPYNTSTSTIYSRDCTPFNVLRCELGDLSSKMFTIEIPPYKVKSGGQEPDIGKFFGTDIELPLCGPVSIVNRSVVVHVADFGAQRLACSTVIEFKPRT